MKLDKGDKSIDRMIQDRLETHLRGVVCCPDDIAGYVMPLVREAIEDWQQESMRRASLEGLRETQKEPRHSDGVSSGR